MSLIIITAGCLSHFVDQKLNPTEAKLQNHGIWPLFNPRTTLSEPYVHGARSALLPLHGHRADRVDSKLRKYVTQDELSLAT